MKKRNGISLIVLIITIIVVIILAAAVILTLSKNNPIESAKEARFKEDVRTFQDELSLAVSKQYANVSGQRDEKINTSDFDEIKEYIPSFSEKYKDKFIIQDDELRYTDKVSEQEKEWLEELKIKISRSLPSDFQQVEYIESTGTQWINTGIVGYALHEFDIQFTRINMRQLMGFTQTGSGYWGINGNGYYEVFFSTIYKAGNRDIIKYDNCELNSNQCSLYVNDNLALRQIKTSSRNEYYLFKINDYSACYSHAKLYSYKAYHNDKLIRDMLPCKYNNKVGLYDTVEGKFYTNQGTGDFIAGPDI